LFFGAPVPRMVSRIPPFSGFCPRFEGVPRPQALLSRLPPGAYNGAWENIDHERNCTTIAIATCHALLAGPGRACPFLLHSLDGEADPDAADAWDRELAERLQQIKSGKAVGESAAKVFADLREKYS